MLFVQIMQEIPDYIYNLIVAFTVYYSNLSPLYDGQSFSYEKRLVAEKVLRFFKIDYDVYSNSFEYNGIKIPAKQVYNMAWAGTRAYLIEPHNLTYQELQDLQDILSKPDNIIYAKDIELLMESLGWTTEVLDNMVKLHSNWGLLPAWQDAEDWLNDNDSSDWQHMENAPDKWYPEYKPDWLNK